jgi:hypothetical protein
MASRDRSSRCIHDREPKGVELAPLNSQAHGVWVECFKHSIFTAGGGLEIGGFRSRNQEIEAGAGGRGVQRRTRAPACPAPTRENFGVAFAEEGAATSSRTDSS